MKPFICMLSIFLLTSCATTGPLNQPESLLDLSGQNKIILTVHGLSCPLCSNNLDGQLQKIDGVESAVIDLKTGAVTVRLKDGHPVTAAEYAADTQGAWYTMLESLNEISDNGDRRADAGLGILHEARRWAVEAALRLPIHENDSRKSDGQITLGWRWLL